LLGPLDKKSFDAVGCLGVIDGLGERICLALLLGQGFEKAAHAVRWIGDEQIEMAVADIIKGLVPVDQAVAIADLNALLAYMKAETLATLERRYSFSTRSCTCGIRPGSPVVCALQAGAEAARPTR
jgi:hypothetical protein